MSSSSKQRSNASTSTRRAASSEHLSLKRRTNALEARHLERAFADFIDDATSARNQSAQTIAWYTRAFRSYRRFLEEGMNLSPVQFQIRAFSIAEWTAWLRKHLVSAVSINSYWRALRPFFVWRAASHGRANPFTGLTQPRIPDALPKALTEQDCRKILQTAEDAPWRSEHEQLRALAVIGVMLYAGLRRGEVLRLRRKDVSLDAKTLLVYRGKGRGGGKDRVAYIPPELHAILADYLRFRDALEPESYLFFLGQRQRGLTEIGLRRIVERLRRLSGVEFTPHALRHTFVTHMIRAGVPLVSARHLAGHADIQTTLGYLRVFDADLHEHAKKIRFW